MITMMLLKMRLKYPFNYYFFLFLTLYLRICCMEHQIVSPCCKKDSTPFAGNLYNAVATRNNSTIDSILRCEQHREEQLKYVNWELGTPCNAVLRAFMDDDDEMLAKLIQAGAHLIFSPTSKLNIFSKKPIQQKKIIRIMNSLSNLDQIEAFCYGIYGKRLWSYEYGLDKKIEYQFFKTACDKDVCFLPVIIDSMSEYSSIVKKFKEIQKNKLTILLKHSRFPPDIRKMVVSMVFK